MKESMLTAEQQRAFLDIFQDLVRIESASDEEQLGKRSPTTDGQIAVMEYLEPLLKEMGLVNVAINEYGDLRGTLPHNLNLPDGVDVPIIALVAHADTNPEGKAEDGCAPNPQVITYEGGDIKLGDSDQTITVADNPHLATLLGENLVVTDGRSLLGGDDKAGIVEILFALRHLVRHPEIKRPNIRVAIVQDEEIGYQVAHLTHTEGEGEDAVTTLDRNKWPVDLAYSVDGRHLGEYNIETYNATTAVVTITGNPVHLMEAREKGFVNALTLLSMFHQNVDSILPPAERSTGREPHTTFVGWNGDYNQATATILLRGFDEMDIKYQKEMLQLICLHMGQKLPKCKFEVKFKHGYKNMAVYLEDYPKVEELLVQAIKKAGIEPIKEPVRGGTDGSRLSELGCPCPNIFTGSMNLHAKTEHLVLSWAYQAVEVLINLMELWGEHIEFSHKHC